MALGGIGALPFGWLPIGSDGGGGGPVGASNGLSIDPISGDVVLGNDFGDLSAPAQLTSPREIKMNNQLINFLGTTAQVGIFENSLQFNNLPGAEHSIYLGADTNVAIMQMAGDSSGSGSPPQIQLTDSAILGRNYTIQVFEDVFHIKGNLTNSRFISLDFPNRQYEFGDIDTTGTGSKILVDDNNSRISAKTGSIDNVLFLDAGNRYWQLGDPLNEFLAIDGVNTRAHIVLGGATVFQLSPPGGLYEMGDLEGNFNSSTVTVDDTNARIILNSGNGFRTNNPGSGATEWLLGTVITAASVLDTTQYVEVKIGGNIVKLATMQ